MLGELIRLDSSNSDRQRLERASLLCKDDWVFYNPTDLPLKLHLKQDQGIRFIGHIKPKMWLEVSKDYLYHDDVIYITVKTPVDQLIITPFKLRSDMKYMSVCSISIDAQGDGQTNKLYRPVSQLTIKNHFVFPIDVVFRGVKMMTIGGADGNGYHSNSRAIKVFDNEGKGFFVGDVIHFYLKDTMKKIGSITIDSKFYKQINLGMNTVFDISKC